MSEYILKIIKQYQDDKYGDFISRLTPNISRSSVLGVRMPTLRNIAKNLPKEEVDIFLNELPHKYYEENILHSVLLCNEKDIDIALSRVNAFLPYIDNWAVNDTLKPQAFRKCPTKLTNEINKWINTKKTYYIRFGFLCLNNFYLKDKYFKEEYIDLVNKIHVDDYYVNMMLAWYLSTALIKQYDTTIKYFENKVFDKWIHNKGIQKAIESFRITDNQKDYLKSLRIK